METTKLPADFAFLPEMHADAYFPEAQVGKVEKAIREVADLLERGERDPKKIQQKLDAMTQRINALQDDFDDHDSEIETGARESIAETVERLLAHFEVDIDIEEAIRERDW